tara:strand:+ start:802 stop:1575 length:774 start_codon:yes stop_codon:yes gene_type:complete
MAYDTIKNMRSFHNDVKRKLITSICNNHTLLLDIGVGRGGDILKWHNADIDRVIGIDLEKSYIQEAIRRFNDSTYNIKKRKYEFYYYDGIHIMKFLNFKQLPKIYNVISCQFAIHYFFKDAYTLTTFLTNVSESLENNGYFIGTFMDAYKVIEFINCKNNNGIIYIKKFFDNPNKIGDAIKVHITGTLYFKEKSISTEYLVFPDVLIKECSKYNLQLCEIKPFEEYYNNNYVQDNIKETSFLNSTFVFKKTNLKNTT